MICMYVCMYSSGNRGVYVCDDKPCTGCPFRNEHGKCVLPREIIFRVTEEWKPTLRKLREDCPSNISFAEFVRNILANWASDNTYSMSRIEQNLTEARLKVQEASARVKNLEEAKEDIIEAQKQQTLTKETFDIVYLEIERLMEKRARQAGNSTLTMEDWFWVKKNFNVVYFALRCRTSVLELEQMILEKIRES
jgi:hypothetical protein